MRHRTESRQVSHPNDVSVCGFAWNGAVDRPIPDGTSWLYGEIPAGSIIFGGFVQIIVGVNASLVFRIGTDNADVLSFGDVLDPGFYPLDRTRFENPTENLLVGLAPAASRLRVTNDGPEVTVGHFCIYLFYINDELGPFGQLLHPLGVPMWVPPPPVFFGTPPVPVPDVPSLLPPAPLPNLPRPVAWTGSRLKRVRRASLKAYDP